MDILVSNPHVSIPNLGPVGQLNVVPLYEQVTAEVFVLGSSLHSSHNIAEYFPKKSRWYSNICQL